MADGPDPVAPLMEAALRRQLGGQAAEALARAQARLAWQEVIAEVGLGGGGMFSRLIALRGGIADVDASDGMLAQELTLRRDGLLRELNARPRRRPSAGPPIRAIRVTVARRG